MCISEVLRNVCENEGSAGNIWNQPCERRPIRSVNGICLVLAKVGNRYNFLVLGDNHEFDNPRDMKLAYAVDGFLNYVVLYIMRIIYLMSYKGNADEYGSI